VFVGVEADEVSGLRVTVRDSGEGMAPGVLARATEPFFTTKRPGHGMGMGLFLARALVEQLGGTLELQSVPGSGTSAVLALPAASVRIRGAT
jgi:two-component system sensor histidine kinase RegB